MSGSKGKQQDSWREVLMTSGNHTCATQENVVGWVDPAVEEMRLNVAEHELVFAEFCEPNTQSALCPGAGGADWPHYRCVHSSCDARVR